MIIDMIVHKIFATCIVSTTYTKSADLADLHEALNVGINQYDNSYLLLVTAKYPIYLQSHQA